MPEGTSRPARPEDRTRGRGKTRRPYWPAWQGLVISVLISSRAIGVSICKLFQDTKVVSHSHETKRSDRGAMEAFWNTYSPLPHSQGLAHPKPLPLSSIFALCKFTGCLLPTNSCSRPPKVGFHFPPVAKLRQCTMTHWVLGSTGGALSLAVKLLLCLVAVGQDRQCASAIYALRKSG